MKIAFTFLFVLSQSDNVKIHQRLIPEEKKATKEKKNKRRRKIMQEEGGAYHFSPPYLWIHGHDLPLMWPTGRLLCTFQSPAHLLPPPWSHLGLLSPACPPSWILDPSPLRHSAGHVSRLLVPDVCFSPLCILSAQHRVWRVPSIINVCRRKRGREERQEGGRKQGKGIHIHPPPFPHNAKPHFNQQGLSLLIHISEVLNWVPIDSNNYQPGGGREKCVDSQQITGSVLESLSMPRERSLISCSFTVTFLGLTDKFILGIHQAHYK